MVTWWERNQTSDVPVARISTDGGETFGAMMMLGTNGTISNTEEGETTEQEAVGGEEVADNKKEKQQRQQSNVPSYTTRHQFW